MSFTEWQYGERVLAGPQSHWFAFQLDYQNGAFVVTVPYTTQFGTGTPPWTATVTTIGLNATATATTGPVPLATYATGYDFQTADCGLANNETAIFWTAANGTYPAFHAVDIDARAIDGSNNPVTPAVTLVSDVNNLTQFRVSSSALGGSAVMLTYSTYDTSSGTEQVHLAAFGDDATPIAGEGGVLDTFTSAAYDAFGFGTLTPSTGAKPGFIYLREADTGGSPAIGFETIGTTGQPTSAFTSIGLDFTAGSTNRQLVDWAWDRLNPPTATSNNLVVAALTADKTAGGGTEQNLEVRVLNAGGGVAADDLVPLNFGSTNLSMTRLPGGGFAVGYTDAGTAYLRQYNNAGDVVGLGSQTLPHNPATFQLNTTPDGRLLVAYAVNGGTSLTYDVYQISYNAVAYRADAGVTRSGLQLHSGDSLTVKAGGTALNTTVASDANGVTVQSGGTTSGTLLNGNGEELLGGASSNWTRVNANASQFVVTGATATGTTVNQGGMQSTGGTTIYTTVNAGGYQFAGQPSTDSYATLNTGGSQWLSGTALGTAVRGGDQLVQSGGQARYAIISSGDQDVTSGGSSLGTVVNGGSEFIESGGTASQSTVNAGGTLDASAGSALRGLTLNAGGVADLEGDGIAVTASPIADNGGLLIKNAGTGSTVVSANITQTGATAGGIEAASGTLELAGTLSGALALKVDGGASLILDAAVGTGSSVAFAGAKATVELLSAGTFHGAIAGFGAGETLDLRSILDTAGHAPSLAYAANANGGTLSLSDGTHAASLALTGAHSPASFHLASDQHGGTQITYG